MTNTTFRGTITYVSTEERRFALAYQPKLETYRLFFEQIPEPKLAIKIRSQKVPKVRKRANLLETPRVR